MIKVKTKHGATELYVNGDMAEIETDVIMILRRIIKGLENQEENGEKAAEEFKRFIKNDLYNDVMKDDSKCVNELLDLFKEFLEDMKNDTEHKQD